MRLSQLRQLGAEMLDIEERLAATAIAITAGIYDVQFWAGDVFRSAPRTWTVGSKTGIRADIYNSSSVPTALKTTIEITKPSGIVIAESWQGEFAVKERKLYDYFWILDEPGDYMATITVESAAGVAARRTIMASSAEGEPVEGRGNLLLYGGLGLLGLIGIIVLARRK